MPRPLSLGFRYKLFFASLIAIVSASYQSIAAAYSKFVILFYGGCSGAHTTAILTIVHFAYFVPPSCGDVNIAEMYNHEVIGKESSPAEIAFISNMTTLSNRKSNHYHLNWIFYLWLGINMLELSVSIPLFAISFSPDILDRVVCKYVMIAWITGTTILILSDSILIIYVFYKMGETTSVPRWVESIGYPAEEAERFVIFDKEPRVMALISYTLTRFLYISLRYFISVPVFIILVGIMIYDLYRHFRTVKKVKKDPLKDFVIENIPSKIDEEDETQLH